MRPPQATALAIALIVAPLGAVTGCAHTEGHAVTEDPQAQSIIDAAQAVFDAMHDKDGERLARLVRPDAIIVRHGPGPEGAPHVSSVSGPDFIATITKIDRDLVERFVERPRVRVDGPVADLWARYELLVDGEQHHCGVDAMHFVLEGGQWRVTAITYSEEPSACPS